MLHRLPEQHDCLFDHLGRGREEAVLKMVKLDRKVGRSCQRIGEECSWTHNNKATPHPLILPVPFSTEVNGAQALSTEQCKPLRHSVFTHIHTHTRTDETCNPMAQALLTTVLNSFLWILLGEDHLKKRELICWHAIISDFELPSVLGLPWSKIIRFQLLLFFVMGFSIQVLKRRSVDHFQPQI